MNPLPDLDNELANTRKVLERVPIEKFQWSPHPKSKSMLWLASHVANLPSWGATILSTDKLVLDELAPPAVPTDAVELLAEFDRSAAGLKEKLTAATPEDLAREWSVSFKGQELARGPRAALLRTTVLNHLIHHRAQLTMYLRMADVPVPGLYGPSADEADMFQAGA